MANSHCRPQLHEINQFPFVTATQLQNGCWGWSQPQNDYHGAEPATKCLPGRGASHTMVMALLQILFSSLINNQLVTLQQLK